MFLNTMASLTPDLELYSVKENRVYPVENATLKMVNGRAVLITPSGEHLVVTRR